MGGIQLREIFSFKCAVFALSCLIFILSFIAFHWFWLGVINIPNYDGRTYITLARNLEGIGVIEALMNVYRSFTSTHTSLFAIFIAPALNYFGYSEQSIVYGFASFFSMSVAAVFWTSRDLFRGRTGLLMAILPAAFVLVVGVNLRTVSAWYPDFSGIFFIILILAMLAPSRGMSWPKFFVAVMAGVLAVYLRRHFMFALLFAYVSYGLMFLHNLYRSGEFRDYLSRCSTALALLAGLRSLASIQLVRDFLWVFSAGAATLVILVMVEPRYLGTILSESEAYGGYKNSFWATLSQFGAQIGWLPLMVASLGYALGALDEANGRSSRLFFGLFHALYTLFWAGFVGYTGLQHMLVVSAITVPIGLGLFFWYAGRALSSFLKVHRLQVAFSALFAGAASFVIILPSTNALTGVDHRSSFGSNPDVVAFNGVIERLNDAPVEGEKNVVVLAAGSAINSAVAQSLIERLGASQLHVLPFGVIDQRDPFYLHALNAADYILISTPARIHLAPEAHSMMLRSISYIRQREALGEQFQLEFTTELPNGGELEVYRRTADWTVEESLETLLLIREQASNNLRMPLWMDVSPRFEAEDSVPWVAENQDWFDSGPRQLGSRVPSTLPFTIVTTLDASSLGQIRFNYRSDCSSLSIRVLVFHNMELNSEFEFGYSDPVSTSELQTVDLALPLVGARQYQSIAIMAEPGSDQRCAILIRDLPQLSRQ